MFSLLPVEDKVEVGKEPEEELEAYSLQHLCLLVQLHTLLPLVLEDQVQVQLKEV
jgi:hypothetical protein